MYNDVDIDKKELKTRVFEKDCNNGHDIISRINYQIEYIKLQKAMGNL